MFDADEEDLIVLPYLTAKIQTLEARCYLESGIISEAQKKLDDAMNSLGYHFSKSEFLISLKTATQLELLRWKLSCPKLWKNNTLDKDTTNYIEQLANCLALKFEVYRVRMSCKTDVFDIDGGEIGEFDRGRCCVIRFKLMRTVAVNVPFINRFTLVCATLKFLLTSVCEIR